MIRLHYSWKYPFLCPTIEDRRGGGQAPLGEVPQEGGGRSAAFVWKSKLVRRRARNPDLDRDPKRRGRLNSNSSSYNKHGCESVVVVGCRVGPGRCGVLYVFFSFTLSSRRRPHCSLHYLNFQSAVLHRDRHRLCRVGRGGVLLVFTFTFSYMYRCHPHCSLPLLSVSCAALHSN